MPIATLTFGDLTIEGASCAGEETWFRIRPPGVAFDVGRGSVQLAGASQLFLTHGHLDHSLGVVYLLSLRRVQGGGETVIHAPVASMESLRGFIEAVERLEETRYRYVLRSMHPGDRVEVGKGLSVEAFATDHLIPSLGFHLLRTRKKLKPEFRGRVAAELADLRATGVTLENTYDELWLSYCGDTGPAVFTNEPRLFESIVLLVECTFFDPATRARARTFKHMHLDDFVDRSAEFRNRELVLHHMSRRYDCGDLTELVRERLALERTRLHLFGCGDLEGSDVG